METSGYYGQYNFSKEKFLVTPPGTCTPTRSSDSEDLALIFCTLLLWSTSFTGHCGYKC